MGDSILSTLSKASPCTPGLLEKPGAHIRISHWFTQRIICTYTLLEYFGNVKGTWHCGGILPPLSFLRNLKRRPCVPWVGWSFTSDPDVLTTLTSLLPRVQWDFMPLFPTFLLKPNISVLTHPGEETWRYRVGSVVPLLLCCSSLYF